jgi:hypothetical protein
MQTRQPLHCRCDSKKIYMYMRTRYMASLLQSFHYLCGDGLLFQ